MAAVQVQLRRGTTANHSSFTGVSGEVTVDTTKKTVVVHDGSTVGGTPLATEASVTAKGDASTNTSSSVDSEVALFSGTGGKTLKRASATGIAKLTSGVLSAATAGSDYAAPGTASTWTASQRGTVTTDNDLSFDMNVTNNFKCTPTAGGALTFTNITSGQSGNILLVNNSNYAITAAATTKVSSTCLATISATGTYLLSYYSDGTNVYVGNTGALA